MSIKQLNEVKGTWPTDQSRLQNRHVPLQLRQSGDSRIQPGDEGPRAEGSMILLDQRIRKGNYFHLSLEQGCWCVSVYNRLYHPRAYVKPEDGGSMVEYKALTEDVTMWNVEVERQIQVKGPDAERFVDRVITRKASCCEVMKARYVILCNESGGILNDPIMLRPAADEFWFSISNSDIGMYLQGVAALGDWDVEIHEIDVAPVQIQGPKAPDLMRALVGDAVMDIPYYGLHQAQINGCDVIISRTGFSAESGYEIYLKDAYHNAEKLWYHVLEVGKQFNLMVIAPGHHRRIEAGILSWGQDMDQEINPYQVGLGWQVDLSKDNFIGKEALSKMSQQDVSHKMCGLTMGGDKKIEWYISDFYHVLDADDNLVGYVSSAWYSPTQGCNIGLAMVPTNLSELGTKLKVVLPECYNSTGSAVEATVVQTPFKVPHDPGTGLQTTGSKL